jgi:hypothetical protein
MTEPTHQGANPMTQPNMPAQPPPGVPGFYPDSQGVMRLWDGQRWTEVTRPMPQPATPPAGQPGYYPDAQGVMRWWTGRDWAPHTQPPATSQPEPKSRIKRKLGWIPLIGILVLTSCGALVTRNERRLGHDHHSNTGSGSGQRRFRAHQNAQAEENRRRRYRQRRRLSGRQRNQNRHLENIPGADEGVGLCYADTKTKKGDILEQEVGSDGESVIIRIKPNAYTFSSSGCGTWKKVD